MRVRGSLSGAPVSAITEQVDMRAVVAVQLQGRSGGGAGVEVQLRRVTMPPMHLCKCTTTNAPPQLHRQHCMHVNG